MKKYHIRSLPAGFSALARIALNTLDGNLYAVGGKLVFTDEAENRIIPNVVLIKNTQPGSLSNALSLSGWVFFAA